MTITSIGGSGSLNPLYAAQQAQAVSAVSVDTPVEDGAETAAPVSGTGLTGSTTASLDSQTLQALLGLQEDPSGPPQQAPGQASEQASGAGPHHHHHRHGGVGMTPAASATSTSPLTATANDPAATAVSDSADGTDASLESALLAA